jgi:hypothetical protein
VFSSKLLKVSAKKKVKKEQKSNKSKKSKRRNNNENKRNVIEIEASCTRTGAKIKSVGDGSLVTGRSKGWKRRFFEAMESTRFRKLGR